MSDPRRPFPVPSASPTMHHCALLNPFVSSPPPQLHQPHPQATAAFMNQQEPHVQQQYIGQNLNTALENDWSPAQFPSMLSGYSCSQQNLDFHTSVQNLFEPGLNYESFQSEVFHYPDPQFLHSSSFYSQTSSTADLSLWGPTEPTAPQLQCSSLGYTSPNAPAASWSSTEYNFQTNTDSFLQFYPNSYPENQGFLSPSTPGPSPHYPPSFVTSPSNESSVDRLGLFVDPGVFTVTSEIQSGPSDVIQEQAKPKKIPRARAVRPRKSRANNKVKALPLPAVTAVEVSAVIAPLSRQQSVEEAETEAKGAESNSLTQGEGRQCHLSLMRDRDQSYYRPPPILKPSRAGRGLHCSVCNTGGAVSLDSASLRTLTSETTAACINIGRSFQAEIPPIRHRRHAHFDSHNALLLWKPTKELESANQQRVEALLKLARSSAVPRGGTSPEDVLLLLSENRGDFLLTVEKLLNKKPDKKQSRGRQTR